MAMVLVSLANFEGCATLSDATDNRRLRRGILRQTGDDYKNIGEVDNTEVKGPTRDNYIHPEKLS